MIKALHRIAVEVYEIARNINCDQLPFALTTVNVS